MKRLPVMVLALIVSVPALAGSVPVTTFGGQDGPGVLELDAPGTVIVEVPAGALVERAVMQVRPLPAGEPRAYPVSPALSIDGAVVWAFNGTGYGPFGGQDVLSDGSAERTFRFDGAGGAGNLTIRLPSNAKVEEATLEVACNGTTEGWTDSRFIGPGPYGHLGFSMAAVGDVNGDGRDDFLAGAPGYREAGNSCGMAVLYFGDAEFGGRPGLVIRGNESTQNLGYSVAGAGDINCDGFADFLVGVPVDRYVTGGQVYLYLGGPGLDATPELVLSSVYPSYGFGYSVSGGGDVNGDGYDDIVVTSPMECQMFFLGLTYVYYGGPGLDASVDVVIPNYNRTQAQQGAELKTAEIVGDTNGDGYDDILVLVDSDYSWGRCPHVSGPDYYSRGFLFSGAPQINTSDFVMFVGKNDYVTNAFSGAGDLDRDGLDDLALAAVWNGTGAGLYGKNQTHIASIYCGSSPMDAVADVAFPLADLAGGEVLDISSAGDVDGDGCGDLVMGVGFGPLGRPTADGTVRLYYGGEDFNTDADAVFNGDYPMDFFGGVVSSAGDVDQDGCDELLVAAAGENTAGNQAGLVHLYDRGAGLVDPWLALCGPNGTSVPVWAPGGLLRTWETTRDFSADLTDCIRNSAASGTDRYGNSYVDVGFRAGAPGPGNLTVTGIKIRYNVTALVPDMAEAMNGYLSAHRSGQMESLRIPIDATAATPARFRLSGLDLAYGLPPRLLKPVPDFSMNEETIDCLLDGRDYIEECDGRSLVYSVVGPEGGCPVSFGLVEGRYLLADAWSGPACANWTGAVTLRLSATDHHGFRTETNPFLVTVKNVQDPPVVTSEPPRTASFGRQYVYEMRADDGDGDGLRYELLERPPGMTMDPASGVIHWYPASRGSFEVSVRVSDGKDSGWQNFTVDVWKNTPPVIVGEPPASVFANGRYAYDVSAFDEEQDPLVFELCTPAAGLEMDPRTGHLAWTPNRDQVGRHPVSVIVTDGLGGRAEQYFTIEVLDDRPRCDIDDSALATPLGPAGIVRGQVAPGAYPVQRVEVRVDELGWLGATGTGQWSFNLSGLALRPGGHTLHVRAFDGNYSGAASAHFTLSAASSVEGAASHRSQLSPVPVMLLVLFIAAASASGRRARRGGR